MLYVSYLTQNLAHPVGLVHVFVNEKNYITIPQRLYWEETVVEAMDMMGIFWPYFYSPMDSGVIWERKEGGCLGSGSCSGLIRLCPYVYLHLFISLYTSSHVCGRGC